MNIEIARQQLQQKLEQVDELTVQMIDIVDKMRCETAPPPSSSSSSSSSTQSQDWIRPNILSPQSGEVISGNTVTIQIEGPPNGRYDIRMNDKTDPSLRLPNNDCGVDKHYLCRNSVNATQFEIPIKEGHEYRFWVHISGRPEWSEVEFSGPETVLKGAQYQFNNSGDEYVSPLYVSITLTNSDAVIYKIPDPQNNYNKEIVPRYYTASGAVNEDYIEGKDHFYWKNAEHCIATLGSLFTNIKRVSLRTDYLNPEFEQGIFIGDNTDPVDPGDPQPPGNHSIREVFVHREQSSAHDLGIPTAISVAKSGRTAKTIRLYPLYPAGTGAPSVSWFKSEMQRAKNEGCIGYAIDLEGDIINAGPTYCSQLYQAARQVGIPFWWEPKLFDGTGNEPAGHLTRHWRFNYEQGINWLENNCDGVIFWIYSLHAGSWITTFQKLRNDGLLRPLIPLGDAIQRTTSGQTTVPFNTQDVRLFYNQSYGVGFFVPGSITQVSMNSEGVREAKRLYS